jgi:hypothetical protein
VLIFPLGPVGVVRDKGRFGEDIEPSKEAECLIEIEVADMATALLVQHKASRLSRALVAGTIGEPG